MKIRITKAIIKGKDGSKILKPNDKVIDSKERETYRKSLKEDETDNVLLTYEEIGE